jgi:hypothetical protein
MFPHFVSASCQGEICGYADESGEGPCGRPATHKVGEAIPWDEPEETRHRHNLTTYVCCQHFGAIFGSVARAICNQARN